MKYVKRSIQVGDWVEYQSGSLPKGLICEVLAAKRNLTVRSNVHSGRDLYENPWISSKDRYKIVDKEEILLKIGSSADSYEFVSIQEYNRKFVTSTQSHKII